MAGVTSNPKIQIQLLPAAVVDAFEDRRDLIVGQMPSVGSAAVDGALVQDVHLKTTEEIRTLFGSESELTHRILMWMSANGGYSPLDVIAKDSEADEDASAATITLSGLALDETDTAEISIVDERLYTVTLQPEPGVVDANDLAAKLDFLLDSFEHAPFVSTVVGPVVTITADDDGTVGDTYGLKVVNGISGIDFTVTQFTGGGGNPGVDDIFDVIEGIRYTGVSWPEYWIDDIDIAIDYFNNRFNVSDGVMDGVVFVGRTNTLANTLAFVDLYNSQSFVVAGNDINGITNTQAQGPVILQPPDWVLAYFMGVRARRLTPGSSIADFIVTAGGSLDSIGGPHSASLPYFNTPLDLTPVTSPNELFASAEQVELEDAGFTTYGVNPAGNTMIMGPVVTTWTTDAAGNENASFHYLNYVDTGSVCREIFFNTLRSTYAQSRLTEGDLIPGYSMANAESIKAELLRIYRVLADQALVQAGREAESYFSTYTIVVVSLIDREVTINGPLPIVTQLGSIIYNLQFSFTTSQTGTQITF